MRLEYEVAMGVNREEVLRDARKVIPMTSPTRRDGGGY